MSPPQSSEANVDAVTRRRLLELGAFAALAAALPAAFRATPAAAAPVYRLRSYLPYIGTTFHVVGTGAEIRLVDASPVRGSGAAFSLLFRAIDGPNLDDAIRTLDHPQLGRRQLFLARVGRGVRGQAYEAIVNRRTTA